MGPGLRRDDTEFVAPALHRPGRRPGGPSRRNKNLL